MTTMRERMIWSAYNALAQPDPNKPVSEIVLDTILDELDKPDEVMIEAAAKEIARSHYDGITRAEFEKTWSISLNEWKDSFRNDARTAFAAAINHIKEG